MADSYEEYKDKLPEYVRTETDFELYKMRHSAEHVLTQAMHNLYGADKVVMAMGPATAEGFYFDFDVNGVSVGEDDFAKIEEEMKRIVKENQGFRKKELSKDEAAKLFADNPYKMEWINEIGDRDEKFTVYENVDKDGNVKFYDLCKGPHVGYTKQIGKFKLLSVAGAYWRGDEKNKMLVRIYGTSFKTQEELDNYLHQIEEAKKRDHRMIGRQQDLFTFSELIGPGLPLYTQKGTFIRKQLVNFVEETQSKEGYMQVWTPQIAKAELYKTSGHYEKYHQDMFMVKSHYSEDEYYLKPMNCPHHTQIYKSQLRSYRDLPIRMTDFAMLYRDEKPGELGGLARVRAFSTDDCHIFCREDQVDAEIDRALQMTKKIMETFGFKYRYRMSIRDPKTPEKYLGDPKTWDRLEKWAVEIMERNEIEYFDGPGEASFYAPKMDLMATDALGREWQLSTIQIDYVMPERFGLKYKDKDGSEKAPVMIHRAILGSAERAMMVLIEHFAGKFPLWLSPDQVAIIPISEDNMDYARKVSKELSDAGLRVKEYYDSSPMNARIREAQEAQIPYMLVLGKREEEKNGVSVRFRDAKENAVLPLGDLIFNLVQKLNRRDLDIHFD